MEPKITQVFRRISKAYRDGQSLIILQGGQGSSKTHSALDLFYTIAKYSPVRFIFTICSYALPHLKLGAIRDFESIILSYGDNPDSFHNKSDHYFRIGESVIDYFGIRDNYSKVTGPRRDFLFINECNNRITFDDFDQLNQRTHKLSIVDFNPRSEFWIHDTVIPNFKHTFIKSTFLDNPYLPQAERDKILWRKDKPQFKNWWRVYGLGEMGQMEDTIFPNWDYGEFNPDNLPDGFALDFGFHPDPDALVRVAIDKKEGIIYCKECLYSPGLLPNDLIEGIGKDVASHNRIVADSSNPRMIAMIKKAGFNIHPVKKTGTIEEWIRLMQDYKLIIDPDSHNLAKELNNYLWLDKKAGIPVDAWNHLIDGIRYWFMDQTHTRVTTKAY